jgi:hypothetical protein
MVSRFADRNDKLIPRAIADFNATQLASAKRSEYLSKCLSNPFFTDILFVEQHLHMTVYKYLSSYFVVDSPSNFHHHLRLSQRPFQRLKSFFSKPQSLFETIPAFTAFLDLPTQPNT